MYQSAAHFHPIMVERRRREAEFASGAVARPPLEKISDEDMGLVAPAERSAEPSAEPSDTRIAEAAFFSSAEPVHESVEPATVEPSTDDGGES